MSKQSVWAAHGHGAGSSSDKVVLKMSHNVGKSAVRFLYDSPFSWKRWIEWVQEAILHLPPFSSSKSLEEHPHTPSASEDKQTNFNAYPICDQLIQLQLFTLRFCCGITGHTELNTSLKLPTAICKLVTKPRVQAEKQSAASSPASCHSWP